MGSPTKSRHTDLTWDTMSILCIAHSKLFELAQADLLRLLNWLYTATVHAFMSR